MLTVAYFTLEFFADYGNEELFGLFNSLAALVGGIISNFAIGRICDKLEPKYPLIKPWICTVQSLIGVVTNSLCYLTTFSFYFSMSMQFLTFLLAQGWMSPALAMIQLTIDAKHKGVAMAVFLSAATLFGSLGVFFVGYI